MFAQKIFSSAPFFELLYDHIVHIDIWYFVLDLFGNFQWILCCHFKITMVTIKVRPLMSVFYVQFNRLYWIVLSIAFITKNIKKRKILHLMSFGIIGWSCMLSTTTLSSLFAIPPLGLLNSLIFINKSVLGLSWFLMLRKDIPWGGWSKLNKV